jgi:hypothetical protein
MTGALHIHRRHPEVRASSASLEGWAASTEQHPSRLAAKSGEHLRMTKT